MDKGVRPAVGPELLTWERELTALGVRWSLTYLTSLILIAFGRLKGEKVIRGKSMKILFK